MNTEQTQAGLEPQLCPHGVPIGVEHGVIFTDTGMCRCCRVSFFLYGSGMYEMNRHVENSWEPRDLCPKCGGQNVHFDSAVLDAEVADKVMRLSVVKRREQHGSVRSEDGNRWEPMFRDVWFLRESGKPVPAYSVKESATKRVLQQCKKLGIPITETDPRKICEQAVKGVGY